MILNDVDVYFCHLLLDHVQFTLIHEPNSPDSSAILFFSAFDFTFITRQHPVWLSLPHHRSVGMVLFFWKWHHVTLLRNLQCPMLLSEYNSKSLRQPHYVADFMSYNRIPSLTLTSLFIVCCSEWCYIHSHIRAFYRLFFCLECSFLQISREMSFSLLKVIGKVFCVLDEAFQNHHTQNCKPSQYLPFKTLLHFLPWWHGLY